MEWFECKVCYEKTNEEGAVKKTTDVYLVDAISFTEAEAIITKEMTDLIRASFDVEAVKREKVSELFRNKDDIGLWFKIKIVYITIDEISAKEKKTAAIIYQQSKDMFSVSDDLKENMKGTQLDWEIKSVTETKVIDVIQNNL